MRRCVILPALLLLILPQEGFAQAPVPIPDPATAAIRIGVLALNPRLSVTDVGIDTNVFASIENPQRDFTATATVGSDVWLRTGRGMLLLRGDTDYVYFDKFVSERGLSSEARAVYEVRLNRLTPFAWAGTRDLKSRPNDEILARVRHYGTEYGGGLDLRVASRSNARAEWHRRRSGFADSAQFDGRSLKTQLTQLRDTIDLSFRQRLTALTTLFARASLDRNEFEFLRDRDSRSTHVNVGLELGQLALIRGIVTFGYHDLRADDPSALPEFSGLTTNVNVAYTAPTQTRLQALVERELQQSYDSRTPHYTELTWGGTITQRLFGRWDLQLTGGQVRQGYLPTATAGPRIDVTDRVGGGIGYAIANQVRASFDISSVNKNSELAARDYHGVVGGFSVTYGY